MKKHGIRGDKDGKLQKTPPGNQMVEEPSTLIQSMMIGAPLRTLKRTNSMKKAWNQGG
jgi:hypothetical protein